MNIVILYVLQDDVSYEQVLTNKSSLLFFSGFLEQWCAYI